ncbi:carbohydrate ABC transporter permease [Paenibacillus aestuarii]|uniref:Sugar ABC transporter permease n=1 Tax=Paenibacillus aestuarii TaxID=516965 RepID=A0ABW0K559_9BACL|nr:sugar ABC transporter permease [Paenibacillus aestuarii]
MNSKAVRDAFAGYLFLLPALIVFGLFIAEPLVNSIILSFHRYDVITPAVFVGLDNFVKFFHDTRLGTVYGNTIEFVLILVPLHLIMGLLLALGVTKVVSVKWKYIFRTAFYFPVLVTTAAVAVAWVYMYDFNFGIMNYLLSLFGAAPIPWLNDPHWVYVSVAIFSFWKFVGNPFLYYLVGLQNIPKSLYEAAEIDGANATQSFFRITLPMLTPTIFFVLVVTLIGAIQIFDEPYLITGGGPGDASRTISLYIYEQAFQNHAMGYASTVSLSLFIIILAITIMQFRFSSRWVSYDQE